jgi:hypothetical protein
MSRSATPLLFLLLFMRRSYDPRPPCLSHLAVPGKARPENAKVFVSRSKSTCIFIISRSYVTRVLLQTAIPMIQLHIHTASPWSCKLKTRCPELHVRLLAVHSLDKHQLPFAGLSFSNTSSPWHVYIIAPLFVLLSVWFVMFHNPNHHIL